MRKCQLLFIFCSEYHAWNWVNISMVDNSALACNEKWQNNRDTHNRFEQQQQQPAYFAFILTEWLINLLKFSIDLDFNELLIN